MGFLRRLFGRDIKTDTAVQNGYTLVADDTKTSGIDWSDVLVRGGLGRDLADGINYSEDIDTTVTPGKYSFDGSTAGDTPGTAGNFEVRERDTTIFQVAQTDDNKLLSRSKIGATAWSAWSEYTARPEIAVQETIFQGPPAGSPSDTFTYTVGVEDTSIDLRVVSPGGGGGGGGGTANNGYNDYGAVGGAGGSAGVTVHVTFTGLPANSTIEVTLGPAGAGGSKGLNTPPGGPGGTPGGAGGAGGTCSLRVSEPSIPGYTLEVILAGGPGGPGGATGGINSCTSTSSGGQASSPVTSINRSLHHISVHVGGAGAGVICGGGGGGINGGIGGIISLQGSATYNTPAVGGSGGGGDGLPGQTGQVIAAAPFNFGKGGGGGGGGSRGTCFGGEGGDGGSGGLFLRVTKLVTSA